MQFSPFTYLNVQFVAFVLEMDQLVSIFVKYVVLFNNAIS